MIPEHRYIVGIDLGTTNCAVSFADLHYSNFLEKKGKPPIRSFKIPQLTGPGEVSRQPMLPSFLYLPGEYEISKEAVALPWPTSHDHVSGVFARDHGARVPTRLVSSAKSWLCHDRVDRRARILPWGAKESVGKVSPVQAAAAYLAHIRHAWNFAQGDAPELSLENQMVVITVPASFDETARDLTIEAAALSGLDRITVIEEPLAAFYSWLIDNENDWQSYVKPGELILVCDVGGGTTDFTLITLRETDGSPRFERLAVGDHLILGGDNMDLELARFLETDFMKRGLSLTGDRFKMLCHQCRQAKEAILGGERESATITLMGEGSRLIAGAMRAELTRPVVENIVLKGFFPLVTKQDVRKEGEGKAIGELGLPYESEPAVTRHLGEFLSRHRADVKAMTGRDNLVPDMILFNGGALKPLMIKERIRESILHWFGSRDARLPGVLESPDQDLAVSLGATYYGMVKNGIGVRVGSGSPRAYYLGVSRPPQSDGSASEAVCLVERGLDEGSDIGLNDHHFQVLANQPVRFDIFSSSFRSGDKCGDILPVDDSFTRLPPIETIIEYGKKAVQTRIPVRVEARYTEMGTLSLWCQSVSSAHRWQMQFQLRDRAEPLPVADRTILETSKISAARETVRITFSGAPDHQAMASLVKKMTAVLTLKKDKWPLSLIRKISDDLLDMAPEVRRTPEVESRWMNLLGYCMRPGRGDGFDPHRVKTLWKRYKQGPWNEKNLQVRSEWWILWRRVAGGLGPGYQRQISQDLTAVLNAGKGKKPRMPFQERLEIWMLIANLEHLLAKDKIRWGRQLLAEIEGPICDPRLLWTIARIGARELLYGPSDRVVDPDEAFRWCKKLMDIASRTPKHLLPAVTSIARKTGDRVRDLQQPQRDEIIAWMSAFSDVDRHLKQMNEVVPITAEEENHLFGESLPSGLVLHEKKW